MQFTFLICSERSGSNFITSLMNGHPQVSGPPPSHLFRLFGLNAHRYGALSEDQNWADFSRDFRDAFDAMLGSWNSSPDWDTILAPSSPRSIALVLDAIYQLEASTDAASQAFVKENHTPSFWAFLNNHWPSCRLVHQVRDPRDVAASWQHTQGIPGGIEKAVDTWIADQSAALALADQITPSDRLLCVRYEDLLMDTAGAARLLCAHLGLDYDPCMLDFHGDDRTIRNADRIDAWSNLNRPVMAGNVGGFEHKLSATDIRYIELRCAKLMQQFDYQPRSGLLPATEVARAADAQALQAELSPPQPYAVSSASEAEIRQQRLAIIDRVLARSAGAATAP
ncbi:sulfotransferase [Maricaulis sp.]|uniref:sulfotransferase family protein n=1 Tax=Maricaulis sp. TaxID=1486257 RepID=UPI001B191000|nr:sulfotransferase [Maricaulis sp.]MBO6797759.1 sulfotransferase [Maricaulis sp.]